MVEGDGALERIGRARAVRSTADAAALYRDWAIDYDADVFGTAGVTGTDRIADLLARHVPDRSAPLLDLGCGTGAAGVRLSALGFTAIDGVDLSPEMLAIAAAKGVYRSLVVADLNWPLPVRPGTYTGSVSAGTFRDGHVGPERCRRSSARCAPVPSSPGRSPTGRRSRRWPRRGTCCTWPASRCAAAVSPR